MYDAFPTLTPDEAGELITDAIIYQPKRKGTRLGTFGEVLYSLSPQTVDQVMNTAYNLFPDSKAAKEGKPAEVGDGKQPEAKPAEKDEEMSTEAVAMAYLMRGVHF